MSNLGLGILALGEISRAENAARASCGSASSVFEEARRLKEESRILKEVDKNVTDYVFAAKSHVHGARASIYAHQITEDKLIVALKAENANHPLASKEAVQTIFEDERVKALTNPEVIKRTFKDGVLPEGTIVENNKVQAIA